MNTWVIFFCVYISTSHADSGLTNMQITSTIVASGCNVIVDSQNKAVSLGSWNTRNMNNSGSVTAPVRFEIELENCDNSIDSTEIIFNGKPDAKDQSLLSLTNTSSAENVGVAILDKNKNRLMLGKPLDLEIKVNDTGNSQLIFYGQFVTTDAYVVAGSASADAEFLISYQ
jgi:minor fimbrial subunit